MHLITTTTVSTTAAKKANTSPAVVPLELMFSMDAVENSLWSAINVSLLSEYCTVEEQ